MVPNLCGGRSPLVLLSRGLWNQLGKPSAASLGCWERANPPKQPRGLTKDPVGPWAKQGSLGCHALHEAFLSMHTCASVHTHTNSVGDEPRRQSTGTRLGDGGSQKDRKGF